MLRCVLKIPNQRVQLRLKGKHGTRGLRLPVASLALRLGQIKRLLEVLFQDEVVAIPVFNAHQTCQVFRMSI